MKKILTFGLFILASVAIFAKDKPEFPGGEEALKKYVAENTKYPEVAKENGVEGIVVIGFIVQTDGSLNDLKVLKYIDPDLENEALKVVKGMPAWIPAEKGGEAIEAPAQVNVPFLLD